MKTKETLTIELSKEIMDRLKRAQKQFNRATIKGVAVNMIVAGLDDFLNGK